MLNKQKGNMYPFVTHTWNPINGECSHKCEYCYMKVFKTHPLHLSEKFLQDDLGQGNFIFVGSSTDMFANDVPKEWIHKVLKHCKEYPKNIYLFQSKDTLNMYSLVGLDVFPVKTVWGTTIETNRDYKISNAPSVEKRIEYLSKGILFERMITIEPIMDFDLDELVNLIKKAKPKWVNIGADSKNHHLPEPQKEKVEALIAELKKFTEVKIKDNLRRILDGKSDNQVV